MGRVTLTELEDLERDLAEYEATQENEPEDLNDLTLWEQEARAHNSLLVDLGYRPGRALTGTKLA